MPRELQYRWEVGSIVLPNTIDNGDIEHISFQNTYEQPVVVAYIQTRAGGQSVQVRVNNVTTSGCDIFMHEPDYQTHSPETATYMVMESGVWQHPQLGKMIAGTLTSPGSSGWTQHNLPEPMPYNPCVFATLNTYNNADFSSIRISQVYTTKFEHRQTSIRTTTSETVGYIVLQRGKSGTIESETFETGFQDSGANCGVDNSPFTINYTQSYSPAPKPLMCINTRNGEDCWARAASSPGTTSHDVYAEEDQVGDSERSHTNESFAWFIVQDAFSEEENPYVYRSTYGNVSTNSTYHFKANEDHINVYLRGSTSGIGQVNYIDGVSAVWANEERLYIATNFSGIAYIPMSSISGGNYANLMDFGYDITSPLTNYIHGAGDFLCVSTVSGVDHYNVVSGTRYYTEDQHIRKCFQTNSGTLYYAEHQADFVEINETQLGGVLEQWAYYQFITFSGVPIEDGQLQVHFHENFSFYRCQPGGADIRFITTDGEILSHYIESWSPNAVVVVKIPDVSTRSLYMLYGNPYVADQSDPKEVYFLYDDFTGAALDTNQWATRLNGDGQVTIIDSYLRIRDDDNDNTCLYSKDRVPYGYTRAELRYNTAGGIATSQMDAYFGYSVNGNTANPNTRGYVRIDIVPGADDYPHYLLPYYDSSLLGTQTLQSSWNEWTLVMTEGYQRSTFRDETLETYGINLPTENYFFFAIHNESVNPDLNINYVIHESWPRVYAYTSADDNSWPDFILPKLHAVYEPTSDWLAADYIYENFIGSPRKINDIHVVEGVSINNNENLIVLGTDRGVHIFEEKRGDEAAGRFKRFLIE